MSEDEKVLIFGASGTIGGALATWFDARNRSVICVSRKKVEGRGGEWISWDPEKANDPPLSLLNYKIKAVVWAQGANCNDNIRTYDQSLHRKIYHANVGFILDSLHALLVNDVLADRSRLVIVSSIWQEISRQDKLSYTVSKAALKGLVHSLSIDLGAEGHLVNAVLPGALDTPMTRANLTREQIENIERATPAKHLPVLDDVCRTVEFLCSDASVCITGQFITVDGGFSYAKII